MERMRGSSRKFGGVDILDLNFAQWEQAIQALADRWFKNRKKRKLLSDPDYVHLKAECREQAKREVEFQYARAVEIREKINKRKLK
jgi:hypothetical protein